MNLQNPKKFKMMIDQAHDVAINVLRPISRKYDKAEHAYPKELDMLASLIDGMNEGGEGINAGAAGDGAGELRQCYLLSGLRLPGGLHRPAAGQQRRRQRRGG